MTETWDAIIVGGGVGGLYLASLLRDMRVLIIEKSENIHLRDSGIVSKQFLNFFPRSGLIKSKIRHMELLSRSESVDIRTAKPFAYILKREAFTASLRKLASRTAEIRYETALSVEEKDKEMIVKTNRGEYRCRIVIGSDGSVSVVRRSAGIRAPKTAIGIMVIPKKINGRHIRVFFNKHYSPDFFSWIIPDNSEYGTISSIRPREYLDFFRKKEGLSEGAVHSYPIPVGFTKSVAHRTLLIGDACGQVKPLTGGGIMFSLRAAVHAGRAISACFAKDKFDSLRLAAYERAWKSDFGLEIKKQLIFRRVYRWLSNAEIDEMFRKFGKPMERLESFDYDKFSTAWVKMPKKQLLMAAIKHSGKAVSPKKRLEVNFPAQVEKRQASEKDNIPYRKKS